MGFEGDSGGDRDSDFGGGFGVEGGGAGYGGYGGVGGSGLGGESPSTGFGGSGGETDRGFDTGFQADKEFRDVLAEVEKAVDDANIEAQKESARQAPEYDIPGPMNPRDIERAPPEDPTGWSKAFGVAKSLGARWARNRATQMATQAVTHAIPAPAIAPLALAGRLAYGQWAGRTPAEQEATFGRGFVDIATGGMFTGAQILGEGVRSLVGAMGVEPLGDVPSSQTDIAGAAPSEVAGDVYAAVERARESGELTRQTPPELLREARAYREA